MATKDITVDANLTTKTAIVDNDRLLLIDSETDPDSLKDTTKGDLRKSLFASPAQGDTLYYNGSDWVRLAAGTSGQFLKTQGSAANPVWAYGNLVQRVEGTPNTTYSSITTAMPVDDSIPQSGEGGEVCTVTITPKSATNRLVIRAQFSGTSNTSLLTVIALFQDSNANALAVGYQISTADGLMMAHLYYEMAAGTTSATTFKLRAGNNSGSTTYVNGTSAGRRFGGVSACRISVDEIAV